MNRILWMVALLASIVPVVSAQPGKVEVHATAHNQFVDLSWTPSTNATSYNVTVFGDPTPRSQTVESATQLRLFLTNGRMYVFVVTPYDAQGDAGPSSDPVAATPHLPNDLAYLASGLIVVWLGVFTYAGLLVRKEARLDRKLEQLLNARFQGRNP